MNSLLPKEDFSYEKSSARKIFVRKFPPLSRTSSGKPRPTASLWVKAPYQLPNIIATSATHHAGCLSTLAQRLMRSWRNASAAFESISLSRAYLSDWITRKPIMAATNTPIVITTKFKKSENPNISADPFVAVGLPNTTNRTESAIKNRRQKMLYKANRKWPWPVLFGSLAFLLSKVEIDRNEPDDHKNGNRSSDQYGLKRRQDNWSTTGHFRQLVINRISFNRTITAVGKEPPIC